MLLTIAEAAAILRAPVATLRYWRHLGTGPRSFRLGRRVHDARVKLLTLDAAETLDDARNRLAKLRDDRAGQHSVRVNQQWRICFRWTSAGTEDVRCRLSPMRSTA